jgi:hypothetical protein
VGIPLTVGFRPQLVVSGLSVGIPLTVGFRPPLVVVSGLSVGIPLTVRFRLSRILRLSRSLFTNSSSFHDRILAITKPSTRNFLFFMTISFFFHDGILGYHEAFHTEFFFFSRRSLSFFTMEFSAITEPSHEFFFHMMESRLSRSLFTNFSFT